MTAAKGTTASTGRLHAEQKAAATHEVAMQIIDSEVSAREKKTQRLRQLRLEREEGAAAPAPAADPRRGKRKSP